MTDQENLELLCAAHARTCSRARCFVRDGKQAVYFHHQIPDQGPVPDSLQDGHGITVTVLSHHRSTVYGGSPSPHPPVVVTSSQRGATLRARCTCAGPEPHPFLVNALCLEYNKL
uniref:E3 12.5K protein n=1 Tax=Cardioderma bat adenovirus TaxID=3141913 RepID=A0AAU7E1S0_9ADEN